jgi:hypothetical protein
LEVAEQFCVFQQDGAEAQATNSTVQMLSEFFSGRFISRNLRLLDPRAYLERVLKETVCKDNPPTLEEPK